ncbi:MAG: hypothetical protein LUD81_08430 [Clostridiales bacterium]|nr:hypothetical protein [Clostridiales bacterium]
MKRKNFEIKEGKHLVFRYLDLKRAENELRFLRTKSLGIHCTEETIKYRLTHKEQYKKMTENQIEKVMPVKYSEDVNRISSKRGKNGH